MSDGRWLCLSTSQLLSLGGTDERPIIRKKTSVTGKHKKPVHLYLQHGSTLFLALVQE